MTGVVPCSPFSCRMCGKPLHPSTLDFGSQPLSNRFLRDPEEAQFTHPLALGVCMSCGLTQIIDPPPASEVAPRFPWIMYNEPEGHLDNLTDLIMTMTGANENSIAAGISYKDDTTLERLGAKGVRSIWRITPEDLGLEAPKAEIETVQDRLKPERMEKIVHDHGLADLLTVRHILEHVHDVHTFLDGVKFLVNPDGMLIFEVPDCSALLAMKDYSTVWEEHVLYFTPSTLKRCLESHGFEVIRMENYSYPLENSLIAFVRISCSSGAQCHNEEQSAGDVKLALDYFKAFLQEKEFYRNSLATYRKSGKKIVLLGAGHLACAFVNLFELQEYIECILDDDPHRQGLSMPGSRLPIKPTTTLGNRDIGLCLLSLNPLNEERVIDRQRSFTEQGGEFRSIFPASRHALRGQR